MADQAAFRREVAGTEVRVDGAGPHTVLMLHGWPDTLALWDDTVAALRDRYRCVRFTWPGFGSADAAAARGTPPTLDALVALTRQVADAVSPDAPLTLLAHDWGCLFGYEFAQRHAERVDRVIGVDIGDHNRGALRRSLTPRQKLAVAGYQLWLALAWQLRRWGARGLADGMTRRMARWLRHPGDPASVHAGMNYPYAMAWFGVAGGLRRALPVRIAQPMLYIYGQRKPFMFHSPEWLAELQARPGCAVLGMRTGHWVMVNGAKDFQAAVRAWLDGAAARPSA